MHIVFTLFQPNLNSTSLVKLKPDPESQEPFSFCEQLKLLPEHTANCFKWQILKQKAKPTYRKYYASHCFNSHMFK